MWYQFGSTLTVWRPAEPRRGLAFIGLASLANVAFAAAGLAVAAAGAGDAADVASMAFGLLAFNAVASCAWTYGRLFGQGRLKEAANSAKFALAMAFLVAR